MKTIIQIFATNALVLALFVGGSPLVAEASGDVYFDVRSARSAGTTTLFEFRTNCGGRAELTVTYEDGKSLQFDLELDGRDGRFPAVRNPFSLRARPATSYYFRVFCDTPKAVCVERSGAVH